MTLQKQIVETYIDGFRHSDHDAILSCLTDDTVWVLHGCRTLEGKNAVDREIENDVGVGSPTLFIDSLIEVFIFTGEGINRLETFHINVARPAAALFTPPHPAG